MPQGGRHPNRRKTKGFLGLPSDDEPSRLFLSAHAVEEVPSLLRAPLSWPESRFTHSVFPQAAFVRNFGRSSIVFF